MVKLSTQLVKQNFKISQLQSKQSLVDYILNEKLKGVDLKEAKELKYDFEFHKSIAEMIENEVANEQKENKNEKVDKMALFETILKRIFADLKPEEMALIKGAIEHMLKYKLIKATPLSKVVIHVLKNRFLPSLD